MSSWSNEFAEQEIVEILRRIYVGRQTGTLEIEHEDSTKHLHFVVGQHYLSSLHPLARTLASHLSAHESSDPASSEQPPDPHEVRRFIRRLAEHMTSWSGKAVRFNAGPPISTCGLVGPLPTAELLMEILEAHRDKIDFVTRLGGADGILVASSRDNAADSGEPAGIAGQISALTSDSELGQAAALVLARLRKPYKLGELLGELEGDFHAQDHGEETPDLHRLRRRWLKVLCYLWAFGHLDRVGKDPSASTDTVREPSPGTAPLGEAPGPRRGRPAILQIWRDHFRLTGDPFALTPDPSVFYLSKGHSEALASLTLGILESRGLVVAIGEVGTGKTTTLYSLLSSLDSRIETAYVSNTTLSFEDLLTVALKDLGAEVTGRRRIDLLDALNGFLYRCAELDKTVALVIDEAQNLSDETFEQLRLLLNFETYKKKLLQIVLVGQPELAERLANPQLRQLADRIAIRCHLNPLNAKDARSYVEYRLNAAGGSTEIFTRAALNLLIRKARGIPRSINLLAHNAMLFAYGEGLDRVNRSLVAKAQRERAGKGLVRLRQPGRRQRKASGLSRSFLTSKKTWLGAAATAALMLTAVVAWSTATSSGELSSSSKPPATETSVTALEGDSSPPADAPEDEASRQTAMQDAKARDPVPGELVRTTPGLSLRAGPGLEHPTVMTLPESTAIEVLESRDGWLRVASAGQEGWVARESVSIEDPRIEEESAE